MTIVMGLDQHSAQITAEWLDTATGEVVRTRVAPARPRFLSASVRCRNWALAPCLRLGGLNSVLGRQQISPRGVSRSHRCAAHGTELEEKDSTTSEVRT